MNSGLHQECISFAAAVMTVGLAAGGKSPRYTTTSVWLQNKRYSCATRILSQAWGLGEVKVRRTHFSKKPRKPRYFSNAGKLPMCSLDGLISSSKPPGHPSLCTSAWCSHLLLHVLSLAFHLIHFYNYAGSNTQSKSNSRIEDCHINHICHLLYAHII